MPPYWSVTVVEGPDGTPLTLAQAKAQCTVDTDVTADDTLIQGYLPVAAELVESRSERALMLQTCVYEASGFPDDGDAIVVPRPPLQDVTSVQYRDTAGVLQTWDPSQYRVITTGRFGRIVPAHGVCYPCTEDAPDAVVIEFVCGYADPAAIPSRYQHAQLMLIAHWYANREAVTADTVHDVPLGFEALIGAPARVDPLC